MSSSSSPPPASSLPFSSTIKCSQSTLGQVIGKQGRQMKKVETMFGVHVFVSSTKSSEGETVTVSGSDETQVNKAIMYVKACANPVAKETLSHPAGLASRLIGKGGGQKDSFEKETGAVLDFDTQECTVKICGEPAAVEQAKALILAFCKRFQDSKGDVDPALLLSSSPPSATASPAAAAAAAAGGGGGSAVSADATSPSRTSPSATSSPIAVLPISSSPASSSSSNNNTTSTPSAAPAAAAAATTTSPSSNNNNTSPAAASPSAPTFLQQLMGTGPKRSSLESSNTTPNKSNTNSPAAAAAGAVSNSPSSASSTPAATLVGVKPNSSPSSAVRNPSPSVALPCPTPPAPGQPILSMSPPVFTSPIKQQLQKQIQQQKEKEQQKELQKEQGSSSTLPPPSQSPFKQDPSSSSSPSVNASPQRKFDFSKLTGGVTTSDGRERSQSEGAPIPKSSRSGSSGPSPYRNTSQTRGSVASLPPPVPMSKEEQEQHLHTIEAHLQKTGALLPSPQKTIFEQLPTETTPRRTSIGSGISPGRPLGLDYLSSSPPAAAGGGVYIPLPPDDFGPVAAELKILLKLFCAEKEEEYLELDKELQLALVNALLSDEIERRTWETLVAAAPKMWEISSSPLPADEVENGDGEEENNNNNGSNVSNKNNKKIDDSNIKFSVLDDMSAASLEAARWHGERVVWFQRANNDVLFADLETMECTKIPRDAISGWLTSSAGSSSSRRLSALMGDEQPPQSAMVVLKDDAKVVEIISEGGDGGAKKHSSSSSKTEKFKLRRLDIDISTCPPLLRSDRAQHRTLSAMATRFGYSSSEVTPMWKELVRQTEHQKTKPATTAAAESSDDDSSIHSSPEKAKNATASSSSDDALSVTFGQLLHALAVGPTPRINPVPAACAGLALRHVLLDGNSLALRYGAGIKYDLKGIVLAAEWFRNRGHRVTIVVPRFRLEDPPVGTHHYPPTVNSALLSSLLSSSSSSSLPPIGVLHPPRRLLTRPPCGRLSTRILSEIFLSDPLFERKSCPVVVSNDGFYREMEERPDRKDDIKTLPIHFCFAAANAGGDATFHLLEGQRGTRLAERLQVANSSNNNNNNNNPAASITSSPSLCALPTPSSGPVSSALCSWGALPLPEGFVCAVARTVMMDPVLAADGFSYERKGIKGWLQGSSTSPLTGESLNHKQLITNVALHRLIVDFIRRHPLPQSLRKQANNVI